MVKAKYNQICNLEWKGNSPKRRGTRHGIKWETKYQQLQNQKWNRRVHRKQIIT